MIYESLRNYLRAPVSNPCFSSRLSTHEAIKAQLYVLGYRLHLTPILEASPNNRRDRTWLDCLFLGNDKPVCGIEVDYSIKKASIKKLHQLPDGVEKIIISYGRKAAASKAIYRHRERLAGIKHFILFPY